MKSRIITGIIGISLMTVILTMPPIALIIAMSLVCVAAMLELFTAAEFDLHRGVVAASVAFSALTPFFMLGQSRLPALIAAFVYLSAIILIQIITHKTQPVQNLSFAFAMSLIFPLSFSCISYLRTFSGRDGLFYAVLAIVIPWMCDMGAYFIGTFFGKHKLCPGISPKKTTEGLFGGIAVSVLCAVAVGILYQAVLKASGLGGYLAGGAFGSYVRPLVGFGRFVRLSD